jgi:hypothetical protein
MMEAGMIHGTSESPFRAFSAWAPLLLACAALAVLGGYLLRRWSCSACKAWLSRWRPCRS